MKIKSLLPTIFLIALFLQTQATGNTLTAEDILEDIRDSLSEDYSVSGISDGEATYMRSWGNANLLSSLPSSSSSNNDLSKYWTGASSYGSDPNSITDIQKAQIFIDALLLRPYIDFDSITIDNAVVEQAASNVTGSIDTGTRNSIVAAANQLKRASFNNIAKIYYRLYNIEKRAQSCNSYWIPENPLSRPVPQYVIADNSANAGTKIEGYDDLEECDKPNCSTAGHPTLYFKDQYSSIAREAEAIKNLINGFSCASNDSQCESILATINNSKDMLSPPANASDTYIDTLSDLSGLIGATQALLLSRFNRIMPSSSSVSFRDIYSTGSTTPSSCPSSTGSNEYVYCGESSASTSLDPMINQITGLATVIPPIRPGIPELSTSNGNIYILVAGKYYEFEQQANLYRSTDTSGSNRIWALESVISGAEETRAQVNSLFKMKRDGFLHETTQNLSAKSAALDIIKEIKHLNTATKTFNPPLPQATTGMQILEDSSKWRLGTEQNNWLTGVSSMSNVSLLRETAILLAEIKQMMYLQLNTNQKQLLVQAISAASDSVDNPEIMVELEADIENYSAGATLSRKSPPEPPSMDSIQSMTDSPQ